MDEIVSINVLVFDDWEIPWEFICQVLALLASGLSFIVPNWGISF